MEAAADVVFVQVGFSLDRLLTWREASAVEGDVCAGVRLERRGRP